MGMPNYKGREQEGHDRIGIEIDLDRLSGANRKSSEICRAEFSGEPQVDSVVASIAYPESM
jgi:hypothetical protein